jgi:hypothetical protein
MMFYTLIIILAYSTVHVCGYVYCAEKGSGDLISVEEVT